MNVSLRTRAFEVAEHGAEVFDWAARIGWEKGTFDWLDRTLTPETTFLDIGAWIGVMTLYASGRCKRIVAVEPDPVAFETLVDNCRLLASLRQVAIGPDGAVQLGSGYLGASTTRKNGVGGRIGESTEFFTSECKSLSQFATDEKLEAPLAIKIDVEGMEEEILGSSLEWLETYKPDLFVELHPYWWFKPEEMERTMTALRGIYHHVEQHGEHVSFHA